jgi:hypothetical protein
MPKLLAILVSLKTILIAACAAVARGDMLPVVLISVLFSLVELGAKPVDPAGRRDLAAVSRCDDQRR